MALNSSVVVADTVATAAQYNNVRKDIIVRAGEYAVTTGSANAYLLSIDSQFVAYATGDTFVFKANFPNTGSCTLNVNGVWAKTMKDVEWNTLATGSILSGAILKCQYDWTDIIVLSGLFATATNKGDVEMATNAEVLTWSDTTRYVNPSQVNYTIGVWDATLAASDANADTTSDTYVKLKEIAITKSGTYRISYDFINASNGPSICSGRTYKNWVALGTVRTSTTSTPATYTEDIALVAWDLIQFYWTDNGNSVTCRVANFRVKGSIFPIIALPTVNL